MQAIYIHGLDSNSRSTKGRFFRERFPDIMSHDYHGGLDERLAQLDDHLVGRNSLILVGSSYGGLMATIFACHHPERVQRLVLLAPALNFPGLDACVDRPSTIDTHLFVGAADEVTPPALVIPIARRLFANLTVMQLDDDHLLHRHFSTLPWKQLLHG